jgi:regulator of protease activity HflC (stomatin/prohibitin superfamily)
MLMINNPLSIVASKLAKLNLDATFSERDSINSKVVTQIDNATDPWGLKVTRYEIKNISPPKQVLNSMEQQMRASILGSQLQAPRSLMPIRR